MPTSYPYHDIFQRLLEGRISPQETETLIEWLARDEQDPEAKAMILTQLKQLVDEEQLTDELQMRMEARLPAILGKEEHDRPSILAWIRYASVAAVLLLIGAGIYLLTQRPSQPPPTTIAKTTQKKQDIAPGKQGAILTLADGRTVVLDSLGNGVVATQNGSKISLNNGRLSYAGNEPAENKPGEKEAYNTMTTPKGRQFQLTLPDGTKVWLNAASSLHYPTAFTGPKRIVDITGEAYFEVAQDNSHPFEVKINETTQIQVLGTHFNINAYKDESTISTTLLEGAVRVVSSTEKAELKPGQQAQVGTDQQAQVGTAQQKQAGTAQQTQASQAGKNIIITTANIEKVMAWKNGFFNFQDATLEEVMRQLQRWYDIDVIYEKGIPKIEFIGKMGRDLSLSEVLDGLQLSKVHFRLEAGRKLVVLP